MLNDLAQRLLTWNKAFQKRLLLQALTAMPRGANILDFGCSTGVLAPFIASRGWRYKGYDIDKPALALASHRNPDLSFTTDRNCVRADGPYNLIFAFSCFHHIDDTTFYKELEFIKQNLLPGGIFFFLDILAVPDDPSWGHRLFMKLEQGQHVRLENEYSALMCGAFKIVRREIHRSNFLSLPITVGPVYNDCLVLTCQSLIS